MASGGLLLIFLSCTALKDSVKIKATRYASCCRRAAYCSNKFILRVCEIVIVDTAGKREGTLGGQWFFVAACNKIRRKKKKASDQYSKSNRWSLLYRSTLHECTAMFVRLSSNVCD